MDFLAVLNEIDNFIWGPPLLVLLVGTGILLTIRLHLLQGINTSLCVDIFQIAFCKPVQFLVCLLH